MPSADLMLGFILASLLWLGVFGLGLLALRRHRSHLPEIAPLRRLRRGPTPRRHAEALAKAGRFQP